MRKSILTLCLLYLITNLFSQRSLTLDRELQVQDQVCWAASIKMAISAYGDTRTQCFIIDDIDDGSCLPLASAGIPCNCTATCVRPAESASIRNCNNPLRFPLNKIGCQLSRLGYSSVYPTTLWSNTTLNWAGVQAEIDANRPFIALVNGGHIVTAKGYLQGSGIVNSVLVNDPFNCGIYYTEIFIYNTIPAVSNITKVVSGVTSVPPRTIVLPREIDTCLGGIRKKLTQAEFDALANSPFYDAVIVSSASSTQRQLLYCSPNCSGTVVTTFEKEENLWRPLHIGIQTDPCTIIITINGRKIALSNKNDKSPNAEVTVPYQKVVLFPYGHEMYIFKDGDRVLYAPANGSFMGFRRGTVYTPVEVAKEYSLHLYNDYIKPKVDISYNKVDPYFPKDVNEFNVKASPPKSKSYDIYLKDYQQLDKVGKFNLLKSQIKDYPELNFQLFNNRN